MVPVEATETFRPVDALRAVDYGAITDLAAKAAGPRARAIAAELTKFANKDLAPFAAAYHRLSETARAHMVVFCLSSKGLWTCYPAAFQ